MQITYGLLTVFVLFSAMAGAAIGAIAIGLFSGAQIESLQRQLNSKAESWCRGCHYNEAVRQKNETIQRLQGNVQSLEDRCSTLSRSNRALGVSLQKRSWGRV